jgi:hypothetical protein
VEIVDSEPDPYTVEEVQALLRVGNEDERLLVRFLVGTGCRDQEVAHLRWEDIDWNQKTIWIHAKKCDCAECAKDKGLWKPKSKAGTRTIPISDSLIRDLKKHRKKDGLVFPAPEGGVDRHFYRIMENLAEKAGVEKPEVHSSGTRGRPICCGMAVWTSSHSVADWSSELRDAAVVCRVPQGKRARNAANGQDKYLTADAADSRGSSLKVARLLCLSARLPKKRIPLGVPPCHKGSFQTEESRRWFLDRTLRAR